MRIVGARATAAALPFDRLIEALRALFASGCVVPQRHVHQPADGMTSLIMPAWVPGGAYAVKIVNIASGNSDKGLPGLHSTVLLHDGATGRPLALIDGDTITARRTAAASALAASYLACPDAGHLLVVGAGRVRAHLRALLLCKGWMAVFRARLPLPRLGLRADLLSSREPRAV